MLRVSAGGGQIQTRAVENEAHCNRGTWDRTRQGLRWVDDVRRSTSQFTVASYRAPEHIITQPIWCGIAVELYKALPLSGYIEQCKVENDYGSSRHCFSPIGASTTLQT